MQAAAAAACVGEVLRLCGRRKALALKVFILVQEPTTAHAAGHRLAVSLHVPR